MTRENLILTGINGVVAITDFGLELKPNQHASAWITCLVKEELPYDILNNQIISIFYQKEEEEDLLWKGIAHHFLQKKEGKQIEVCLFFTSATIKLDQKKYTRTFQNVTQSYETMLKSILNSYPEADILITIPDKQEQNIQDVIIQYQETDWEFCKRIASHFHSVLIPNIKMGEPKFYFGFPIGTPAEEVFSHYTVSIDKRYYKNREYASFKEQFVFYQVESKQYYPIGTQIAFQKRNLLVLSLTARIIEGEIRFFYEIGLPNLYYMEKYYNRNLIGAAFMGTVIEREKGFVKVAFDINPKEEGIQKTYPFTSVTGNLFSCMPEQGEKVFVLFQSEREADGIAIEAFRNNDIAQCPNISSYSDRYFTTKQKKEMKLVPDSMGLDTHTGNLFKIEDEKGITLEGTQIRLEAKGDIVLKGEQIEVFAPLQTTLLKGSTGGSINICQDFNTSGPIKFLAQASPYTEGEAVRLEKPLQTEEMERQALGMLPTGKSEDSFTSMGLGMLVQ